MTIPDRWKQPPLQADKDDKKMTREELVAKLLAAGLARSTMEAKQMAASMLNVEKTQQQFEREILKSSNLPRAQKTVNSQDLVVSPNEKVDGTVNVSDGSAVVNNADITALTARVSTLNDHIARQQQIIERLEHDVAFIRTTLQNLKTESTPVYPKTPTANELLEQKEAHEVSVVNELSDSDAESFISPSK